MSGQAVMYRRILVALENSHADDSLLPHVADLARLCGAELLLFHVADGWAARHFEHLKLAESEEMRADREYLDAKAGALRATGLLVRTLTACGDPPREILRVSEAERCDLIAMATHGHRLLGDIFFGSTIREVRHASRIPLLLVRAGPRARRSELSRA
jgi:manganese transport protein